MQLIVFAKRKLLGALALVLADRITRMADRASANPRGSVGCVLRNVRRAVQSQISCCFHLRTNHGRVSPQLEHIENSAKGASMR